MQWSYRRGSRRCYLCTGRIKRCVKNLPHKTMEVVEFNGQKIRLMKLPKDTLLFRAVQHSESDFVGANVSSDKLCIPVNYNVFFYASPFVVDGIHWFDDGFPNVDVYKTPHELTVVSMINPSTMSRSSRNDKGQNVIEPCSEQKACLKGREYDPCFKHAFLKKFPNVHGWVALTAADSREVLNAIKQRKLDAKDIPLVEDSRKVRGPMEVALYPLKTRSLEDVFIDHPVQWKASNQGEYNYEHVTTLKRHCADRAEFMAKHATYDPTTKMYTLKDGESVTKGVLTDESAILNRMLSCINSKDSVSNPSLASGLPVLPEQIADGPWEQSAASAKRTIDYIVNKLHHACYVLCVAGGKGQLFKIENRTTAPGFKPALFHPRNKTLRDAPDSGKQWRVIQCLVREYADEGSTFSSEYAQFIEQLKYPLPNGAYILNLTDAVLLRKDFTEPWPFVTGSAPLDAKYKSTFLPILGGSGHVKYWDVPMPNYDDVRIALGRDKDLAKPEYTRWGDKNAKAVFRGAPTGCGYTTETNMRLKLATMKSDDLDVGVISVRQGSLKFDPGEGLGRLDMSRTLKPVDRLSLEQQAKYKYIIHIDGNVAAYRLLKMMTLGSVILKVTGPYTTWVDHVLKDREHYVSVKEDLSDLQEVIEWCKTHDDECSEIATRAREFATQALSRDYVESTFAKTLWEFTGESTPAKNAINEDELYEFFAGGRSKGTTAVFMCGATGTGKSTLVPTLLKRIANKEDTVTLNIDALHKRYPSASHEELQPIFQRLVDRVISNGLPFVYDGTCRNRKTVTAAIQDAKRRRYTVTIGIVYTTLPTAIERAMSRTERPISEEIVRDVYQDISKKAEMYFNLPQVDNVILFNNETDPLIVLEKKKGVVKCLSPGSSEFYFDVSKYCKKSF